MEPVRRTNLRGYLFGTQAARAIAALALAFALLLPYASNSPAAVKSGKELSLEDRAAVEKASRSSYRKLEITSIVVIFVVGAGAVYWVLHRRKP